MTPNQFRKIAHELKSEKLLQNELDAVLRRQGINRAEFEAYLNHADKPALWEEDRGN